MTEIKDVNKNVSSHQQKDRKKMVKTLFKKQFIARNSLLTDLFENNHIRCIYRIFAAAIVLLSIRFILAEFIDGEPVTFGTKYIIRGFKDFHYVILLWTFMFVVTLLIYPLYLFWANVRIAFITHGLFLKAWDITAILSMIIYGSILIYVPLSVRGIQPAMANSLVILLEQLRFLMKMHAFLRSNIPRVLCFKPHTEKELDVPKFSSFLYYLFAPTFIYRDSYPRNKKTNWKYAFTLVIEFIAALFLLSFLIDAVVWKYKDFGLKPETWVSLFLYMIESMLISPFMFVGGFYTLLHVWMNLWSEILTFADRQFYEDWWNSTTFSYYYRSWNMVVHGYLHTYIYKDFLQYITPGNKLISASAVILISGIIHEYVLYHTLDFFLPIMFFQFAVVSLPLSFMKIKNSVLFNCFFLWAIIVGTGMQVSFYAMEYYARINCPIPDESRWKGFEFRLLSCNGLNIK